MSRQHVSIIMTITVALGACGGERGGAGDAEVAEPDRTTTTAAVQRHPDVVGVEATSDDRSGTWTFTVTISSPYDTPDRYADGWRVVGPDGTVYGVHTLTHDHASEQPFTRRQTGVVIPDGVDEVTIEGRDQTYGFGGTTMTIALQTGRP